MPLEKCTNYENMKIASNSGINNIIQRNGSCFLLFYIKAGLKKLFVCRHQTDPVGPLKAKTFF